MWYNLTPIVAILYKELESATIFSEGGQSEPLDITRQSQVAQWKTYHKDLAESGRDESWWSQWVDLLEEIGDGREPHELVRRIRNILTYTPVIRDENGEDKIRESVYNALEEFGDDEDSKQDCVTVAILFFLRTEIASAERIWADGMIYF